jgi:hypothetical protein
MQIGYATSNISKVRAFLTVVGICSMPDVKTGYVEINSTKIYCEAARAGQSLVFVQAGIADSRIVYSNFWGKI